MNDTQIFTIALATVPTMLTVLMGILVNNSRLSNLRNHLDARLKHLEER